MKSIREFIRNEIRSILFEQTEEKMTVAKAKQIIRNELDKMGLSYKLKGSTTSFQDLARDSSIVITIVGWKPDPRFKDLKKIAHENGFILDA